MEKNIIKLANGTTGWFNYGKFHRVDGPAIIFDDGTCEWRINGKKIVWLEIKEWCIDTGINTDWKEWTKEDVAMFVLRFS